MNHFEITFIMSTVVALDDYLNRTPLLLGKSKIMQRFSSILDSVYTVNTKIDINKVEEADIRVVKQITRSSPCSYDYWLEIICNLLLTAEKINIGEVFETGWEKGRVEGTLKKFFLILKYGGVNALETYIVMTSKSLVCPGPLNFAKDIQKDYICIACYRDDTESFTSKDGEDDIYVLPSIFLDYRKITKIFKIPLASLENMFYMDCNNELIPIFIRKKIITRYTSSIDGQDLDKIFCETSRLFGKTPRITPEFESFTNRQNNITEQLIIHTSNNMVRRFYTNADVVDLHRCPIRNIGAENDVNLEKLLSTQFSFIHSLNTDSCDDLTMQTLEKTVDERLLWIDSSQPERIAHLSYLLFTTTRNYKLRKCYFNKLLEEFRYDFLEIANGKNMLNPDIYFEKNNFSSIFDATVLNDMTSQGVIWALSAKIRKSLIRTGSDPKDVKIATMKYADKSNGVFGFYNIVHELAVGLAVNTLKNRVPNFMYTWGGFVCSPPERNTKLANPSSSVEYKYKFEKMCVNSYENPQVILLNEFINGNSLRVLLDQKDFNYTMFLEIIFQLACAIDIAQKELSFIHNDLHSENVLVQISEHPSNFNYDGKTISSHFIPVIIDYGRATLKYNEMFLPAISETSLFSKRHGELPRQNDITDIFTLFRDADKFKERIEVDFPYYNLDDVIQKAYTQLQ